VTHLRKMMLEELQRRNYSDRTADSYIRMVAAFAKYFGKSPDKLGPDDLRRYQAYLLKERKLGVGTVIARVAALRFFYVRTPQRHDFRQDLPYPKKPRRLPTILSLEEVGRLIDAAGNLRQRAMLMILYGTGMRRREVAQLKVSAIDSQRMIVRVDQGKGGHDRDLPLSPALLETLREYWRWRKPVEEDVQMSAQILHIFVLKATNLFLFQSSHEALAFGVGLHRQLRRNATLRAEHFKSRIFFIHGMAASLNWLHSRVPGVRIGSTSTTKNTS